LVGERYCFKRVGQDRMIFSPLLHTRQRNAFSLLPFVDFRVSSRAECVEDKKPTMMTGVQQRSSLDKRSAVEWKA
jgi:hypothetical protein